MNISFHLHKESMGFPWKIIGVSMEVDGRSLGPWISVESPWISMDVRECPEISWRFHGYARTPMELQAQWTAMDLHRSPWF